MVTAAVVNIRQRTSAIDDDLDLLLKENPSVPFITAADVCIVPSSR